MVISHFQAMIIFAVVASVAFAFHSRQTPKERARYAIRAFLLFVGSAVLIGWLMYPLTR